MTDHEVAYGSQRAVERGRNIRAIARAWNVGALYDAGRGGHGHIFPIEAGLIRPGMFLFCYDMHCTNFGAAGALAMAAGTEVTSVLATGSLWTTVPHTLRIDLQGALAGGAHPRDVGFLLAQGFADGRWGVQYDYRVVEFGGPGLASLDLAARVALCNSITEMGVANVLLTVIRQESISAVRPISGATPTRPTKLVSVSICRRSSLRWRCQVGLIVPNCCRVWPVSRLITPPSVPAGRACMKTLPRPHGF